MNLGAPINLDCKILQGSLYMIQILALSALSLYRMNTKEKCKTNYKGKYTKMFQLKQLIP